MPASRKIPVSPFHLGAELTALTMQNHVDNFGSLAYPTPFHRPGFLDFEVFNVFIDIETTLIIVLTWSFPASREINM
jgi:hypothetical protein